MAYGSISNQTFNFDPSTIRINANQIDGQLTDSQIASISAAKVSGTLAANNIPNLSASKITSGILSLARGGTGVSSLSALKNELGISGGSVQIALTTSTSTTFSFKPYLVIAIGDTRTSGHISNNSALGIAIRTSSNSNSGVQNINAGYGDSYTFTNNGIGNFYGGAGYTDYFWNYYCVIGI